MSGWFVAAVCEPGASAVQDALAYLHLYGRGGRDLLRYFYRARSGQPLSIGTLLAFVIVSVGVLVLRIREPNLPRNFKTPAVWFVAPLGALSALSDGPFLGTWLRLLIWFGIGLVIYFAYGMHRSNLAQQPTTGSAGV